MKNTLLTLIGCIALSANSLNAQSISLDKSNLEPVHVFMSVENQMDNKMVRVVKDSSLKDFDEPVFAKIKGVQFKNGSLEVKVLSRLLKDAPDFARGFIGVAFRINDSNSKFECIYLRPVNSRVDDQVRRNHCIQYYSYPDYKYDQLRKESPEKYESYADIEMNKWIMIRIEVKDAQAKLFLNDGKQPALIVNDLKLGTGLPGAVGLWVEAGTEGFFSDLKVRRDD